jgi:hypothetical protein
MYILIFLIIIIFLIFKKNKEYFSIGGQPVAGYDNCNILTKIWDEMLYDYVLNVPCNNRLIKSSRSSCGDYFYINEHGENIKCVDDTGTSTYTIHGSSEPLNFCKDGSDEQKYCNGFDGYPTLCSLFPYYTYYAGINRQSQSDDNLLSMVGLENSETGCQSLSLNDGQNCSDYFEYNENLEDFYKCKNDPNLDNKCTTNLDLHCKDKFLHELSSFQIYSIANAGFPGSGYSYYIDKFLNLCSSGIKTLGISLLYLIFSYVTENIDLLLLQNDLQNTGPSNPDAIYNTLRNEEMADHVYEEAMMEIQAAEDDDASSFHFSNVDYEISNPSISTVREGSDGEGDLWNDYLTSTSTIDAKNNDYTLYMRKAVTLFNTNNVFQKYMSDLDKILDKKYENVEYMGDIYPYPSGTPDPLSDPPSDWFETNYPEYYDSD